MFKILFGVNSSHKFDKNSHLIPVRSTFGFQMIPALRFFTFFLFTLLFFLSAAGKTPIPAGEFDRFQSNGKYGLKNQNGDIVIPAQYDALGWSNGKFSVVDNVTGYSVNGLWGLINLTNHKVTKPEYLELSADEAALIVGRKKIKNSIHAPAGCISSSGKMVIPFNYDGIKVSGLRAIVYQKSGTRFTYGLIDFKNEVLIPLKYESIFPLGSLRFGVVSFDGKTGIFSEAGEQLTPFDIDSISSFNKNFAVIHQNLKQGLIDREGKIVLNPQFKEVRIDSDGKVSARRFDSWLMLDGDNKILKEAIADSVICLSPSLYKMKFGKDCMLLDKEFRPVNKTLFSDVSGLINRKAIVSFRDKKGVIRENGSVILKPMFKDVFIEADLIRASQLINGDRKWSVIDSTGKTLTSKTYNYIGPFNGEFFPTRHKGFWGVLDKNGKEIVACVHDSIVAHSPEHIVVKFKGQYGVITRNEEWIITPQRNKILLFDKERYIEITPTHKFLKSFKGDVIYFTENPIEIKSDHLLEHTVDGILEINKDGLIAATYPLSEGFEKLYQEFEGYRAIKKDGKSGFVDNRGRLRIANRYEDVTFYSEGLAGAKLLGKWGFINKQDKIAIQPVYDEVGPFQDGFSIVRQKNLYGLINFSGKVLIPVRYEKVEKLSSNRFLVQQNNLLGLAEGSGKILLNPKFEILQDLNNGYILVGRHGLFGVITTAGLSTIPMLYESITYDPYNNQYLALKKASWENIEL
jgi:hypothetical protein